LQSKKFLLEVEIIAQMISQAIELRLNQSVEMKSITYFSLLCYLDLKIYFLD
jgi:hypothetical protein